MSKFNAFFFFPLLPRHVCINCCAKLYIANRQSALFYRLDECIFYLAGVAVPLYHCLHSQEKPVWAAGGVGAWFWGEWGDGLNDSRLFSVSKKINITPCFASTTHRWTPSLSIPPGHCWCRAAKTAPPPSGTPEATRRCSKSSVTAAPFTTWASALVRSVSSWSYLSDCCQTHTSCL